MEDCRLRSIKNRVLKGVFGPKREEVGEFGRKMYAYIIISFKICTPRNIVGMTNQRN